MEKSEAADSQTSIPECELSFKNTGSYISLIATTEDFLHLSWTLLVER